MLPCPVGGFRFNVIKYDTSVGYFLLTVSGYLVAAKITVGMNFPLKHGIEKYGRTWAELLKTLQIIPANNVMQCNNISPIPAVLIDLLLHRNIMAPEVPGRG